jgi:circadian clock protein KaiC
VKEQAIPARVSTGVAGLDDVLGGGLPANRLYLVQGDPGVGKTTLALQYLLDGARRGERVLYITLSETEEELRSVADSHGWALEGVSLFELSAAEQSLTAGEQNTLFHPSEVELKETTQALLAQIEKVQPTRVVFDSLSEMRLLAQSSLRYRRQILALKQYFAGKQCTVLMLDDRTSEHGDLQVQSVAHGVIDLHQLPTEYGSDRRRLRVMKLRGVRFRGGFHDFSILTGGLAVFPRLVAAEHHTLHTIEQTSTGVKELDALLGGGLPRGSSTLIMGPAGTGKSSVAVQAAVAAAGRGERAAMYIFDERLDTLLARSDGIGIDLRGVMKRGMVSVRQVDPAEQAPGEFAAAVRDSVERDGARVVVIDTLNGYMNAMPEARFLTLQLHELLTYLGQRGVITIMVVAQHGMMGANMMTPVDTSYLADTVMLLRYFEYGGVIRQAISVIKKRSGTHERTLREFTIRRDGLHVGRPLEDFRGVLTGVPEYKGSGEPLFASRGGGEGGSASRSEGRSEGRGEGRSTSRAESRDATADRK